MKDSLILTYNNSGIKHNYANSYDILLLIPQLGLKYSRKLKNSLYFRLESLLSISQVIKHDLANGAGMYYWEYQYWFIPLEINIGFEYQIHRTKKKDKIISPK